MDNTDNILYRNIKKEDYETAKYLIGEAFCFNKEIKDKNFLNTLLNIYLQDCLVSSSYGKVAVKEGKVIGIILGSSKNDKLNLRNPHNLFSLLLSGFKVLITNKENKKILKEFSTITETYKEIIEGKENAFQGCIELFIVSKESQGLGVGKVLVNDLFDYMKTMDVKSLYLYTDTICNYGFYEHEGFKRVNEKRVFFDSMNENLDVFLYRYTF